MCAADKNLIEGARDHWPSGARSSIASDGPMGSILDSPILPLLVVAGRCKKEKLTEMTPNACSILDGDAGDFAPMSDLGGRGVDIGASAAQLGVCVEPDGQVAPVVKTSCVRAGDPCGLGVRLEPSEGEPGRE